MPLRRTSGTPIASFAKAAMPATFGAAPAVRLRPQHEKNWCWAACAEMVGLGGIPPVIVTQCALASQFVAGATGCCQSAGPSCDQALSATAILAVLQSTVATTATQRGALAKIDLDAQIAQNRPVEVGWLWSTGGGHVVLVVDRNVSNGTDIYTILDPWPPNTGATTTLTMTGLQNANGKGLWDCSFTDL